nr:hypothetical protein [uncultured Undibacterium sp.]
MSIKLKSMVLGSGLAIFVFQVAIHLLGYTAAIAIPAPISHWAAENSTQIFVLFLWDLLVVQFLGIGILAALAILFLLRLAPLSWLYVGLSFIITETLIANLDLWALSSSQFLSITNLLTLTPHFIAVSMCVLAAAKFGGKSQAAA